MNKFIKKRLGFTIVELIVVITVIGILAAIVTISYSNITKKAKISIVQNDLSSAIKQLENEKTLTDNYPLTLESVNNNSGLNTNDNLIYNYSVVGTNYCMSASYLDDPLTSYVVTNDTNSVSAGSCVNSWKKVSGGASGFCAINYKNETFCWGENSEGQLGDGTYVGRISPTKISAGEIPDDVYLVDIEPGDDFTCGLGSNGKAYCWGGNWYGQLGTGSAALRNIPTPVEVASGAIPTGVSIKSITVGARSSCVIDTNNATYCWGHGADGAIGDGYTTSRYSPTLISNGEIPGGVYLEEVKTSVSLFCGLGSNDKVYCWGQNYYKGVGNDSTVDATSPKVVLDGVMPGGTLIKDFAVGGYHACAVSTDDDIYCWGFNREGTLGDGTLTDSGTPVKVLAGEIPANSQIVDIESGWYFTCAKTDENKVYCWGANSGQELGNDSGVDSNTPVEITNLVIPDDTTISSWSSAVNTQCAITNKNGAIYCWGDNMSGELGLGTSNNKNSPTATWNGEMPTGVDVQKVVVGNFHGCLLATNNKVYCWAHSQIDNDSNVPVEVPQGEIPDGVTLVDIISGWSSNCVIGDDGWAYCWGYDYGGNLGNGTEGNKLTPTAISQGEIPDGVTIETVVSGGRYSCALSSNDKVYCWGDNTYGQLGNGTTTSSTTPVEVLQGAIPGGVTIKSIAEMTSGGYHTCVIGSNNIAYCWGENNYGQIGDNTTTNRSTPVATVTTSVPSGVTAKSISAGLYNTCMIGSDNKIYCWGLNGSYELGYSVQCYIPRPYPANMGEIPSGEIKYIATGRDRTCAIASNDKAYCWGSDVFGTLGHGDWGDYSYRPRVVADGETANGTFSTISPGYLFVCGTSLDNKSYCWGAGYRGGLLGNGVDDFLGYPAPIQQF